MIKVDIDEKNGQIAVWNNGQGVPIEIHKEHNVYVPEMIFGKANSLNFRPTSDILQLRRQ
jgi:DNA gyrase/topoisomerase IV subunit B